MAFYEDKSISVGKLLIDPLGALITEQVTLLKLGTAATYLKGRLLGKITGGGAVTAAVTADGAGTSGANTGTGTVVMDSTTPILTGYALGAYSLKCISAATADPAADAVFEIYAPNGAYIGKTDAGTGGDTWAKQVKFVITDKATAGEEVAFAVGDGFLITLTQAANANAGKLVDYDPAGTDGRENIYGILGNDVTVGTAADATGSFVYLRGLFDQNSITAKDGVVVANCKDELRTLGIYIKNAITE